MFSSPHILPVVTDPAFCGIGVLRGIGTGPFLALWGRLAVDLCKPRLAQRMSTCVPPATVPTSRFLTVAVYQKAQGRGWLCYGKMLKSPVVVVVVCVTYLTNLR